MEPLRLAIREEEMPIPSSKISLSAEGLKRYQNDGGWPDTYPTEVVDGPVRTLTR